jgi:hypothetical protein
VPTSTTDYAFELIFHHHDIMVWLSFSSSLVNTPPGNFFCFAHARPHLVQDLIARQSLHRAGLAN